MYITEWTRTLEMYNRHSPCFEGVLIAEQNFSFWQNTSTCVQNRRAIKTPSKQRKGALKRWVLHSPVCRERSPTSLLQVMKGKRHLLLKFEVDDK